MKKNAVPIMVALLLTLLSLMLHITSPSTFRLDEAHFDRAIETHKNNPAFKVRPMTTSLTEFIHDIFGMSNKSAFFTLQFILLFISGVTFFYYLVALKFNRGQSLGGMIIYFMSLPIMLAHFEPIFTWSDFWIYIFIPLAFIMTLRKQFWLSLAAMLIATVARETTLIFYLPWLYLIYTQQKDKIISSITIPSLCLFIFVLFRLILFSGVTGNPQMELGFNFENSLRTSDTIFSLTASLGFLWVVSLGQLLSNKKMNNEYYKFLTYGAILTVLGFSASTLLMARARETRLFFPPYIFLIPLALIYFQSRKESIKRFFNNKVQSIIVNIILLAGSCFVSWNLFEHFEYRRWQDGQRLFWALNLAVIIFIIIIEVKNRRANLRSS